VISDLLQKDALILTTYNTGLSRETTFRSKTDCIQDGDLKILWYNIL